MKERCGSPPDFEVTFRGRTRWNASDRYLNALADAYRPAPRDEVGDGPPPERRRSNAEIIKDRDWEGV